MHRYISFFIGFLLAAINLQAQNNCEYQLILNDAGGDGWQGAGITFFIETTPQLFTITGSTDTFNIALTEGDSISIRYQTGPNNAENSFQLIDSDGQVVSEEDDPLQGIRFDDFASCPICPSIELGSQMNIDSFDTSVVIDWGSSDSLGIYQIEYAPCGFLNNPDSVLLAQSSISEATLLGLRQKTCYEYQISLVCLGGDTSIISGVNQINTIFTKDVGVSGVFAPAFGDKCDFLTQDTLFLILKNFGAAPQTLIPFDFTLTYNLEVIGGNVQMPTDGLFTGVIAKDSCIAFPFEELIDVSEPGEYTINVRTGLEGDSDNSNDSFTTTFTHTFLLPFFEGFEDTTLPERWSSDEVDPFFNFNGSETVSSILDPLNSKFELTTARYGRIQATDSLSFSYAFAADDPTGTPTDLVAGDQLLVEISTDCGESYLTLDVIDMVDVNPNVAQALTDVSIPLNGFIGNLVNFRFTALRGGTSFRIVLDDINVYNCVADAITINDIVTFESVEFEQDGSITVSPIGGIAPYTFEWSNSTDVTMGTSSTITGLAADVYSVTVTDAFGCFASESFNVGIVATDNFEDLVDINLYPNPARDIITLDLALEQAQALDVVIYNAVGQQMWSNALPSAEQHRLPISLVDYSAGLYFIQIQSEQGQITKRFIVNN